MKQKKLRSLSAVLLIGWCLIFLRCETTEKSMVEEYLTVYQEALEKLNALNQTPQHNSLAEDDK